MKKLRLLSLFSGIGSFEKALTNLNIPFKVVRYCEVDKYPSKAFSLIHKVPESKNLWDITKVDPSKIPEVDLITYGFPCQDISTMGRQAGIIEGVTRSGLLYEALKIIENKKPKYLIAENVKNLVGNVFKNDFHKLLMKLSDLGYNSYWSVINSKDHNVAQHRERVIIVSIRRDIEETPFSFPEKIPLEKCMNDYLLPENTIDEKYYLSGAALHRLSDLPRNNLLNSRTNKIELYIKDSFRKSVYQPYGISPTVMESHGDVIRIIRKGRIRKITPIEAFKLMGFDSSDCELLLKENISDARLYKMAGNTIVVPVLERIFEKLLLNT